MAYTLSDRASSIPFLPDLRPWNAPDRQGHQLSESHSDRQGSPVPCSFPVLGGCVLLLVSLLLSSARMTAQSELHAISTTNVHPILNPDPPDYTFGVVMDPDGVHAWATVSGTIGFVPAGAWNNRLLKIDMNVGSIVDQAIVGLFPEDVELRFDQNGQTELIFVTGNGSSEVTAIGTNLQPVGTVNLGFCFGSYSNFPFEMAFNAGQNRLFVGSTGCDNIFEIDSDPGSPNFLSLSTLLTGTGAGGSLEIHPSFPNTLLTGGSQYFNNFSGGVGTFNLVDYTQDPPVVTTMIPGTQVTGDFASVSDIVPLSTGEVLLVENSQVATHIHRIDLATETLVATYDLQQQMPGLAFLHQADIDADERILMVSSLLNDVIFFDLASGNVVSTLCFPGDQPSDVAISAAGDRAAVTFQNAEFVRIFDQIPTGLKISTNAPLQLGQTVSFDTWNGPAQDMVYWFASFAGPGPTTIAGGYQVALGAPIEPFFAVVSDGSGQASVPITVPSSPVALGITGYLQAVTFEPHTTLRFSNPLAVTVVP